jgi:hypothetical protein
LLPTLVSSVLLLGLAYRFVPTVRWFGFFATIPLGLLLLLLFGVGLVSQRRAAAHQATT